VFAMRRSNGGWVPQDSPKVASSPQSNPTPTHTPWRREPTTALPWTAGAPARNRCTLLLITAMALCGITLKQSVAQVVFAEFDGAAWSYTDIDPLPGTGNSLVFDSSGSFGTPSGVV